MSAALTLALTTGDFLTTLLPLLGILLILASMWMAMRKRRARQGTQVTAREQLERMKQEKAVRGDLEHLMVELEQLTKRFAAQLDAKSAQLEKLLDEADQRIEELRRAEERAANRPAEAYAQQDPWQNASSRVEPPAAPPTEEDNLARQVYQLSDQGLAPFDIARRLDEHVGKVELMLALRKV